jgi:PST family polysaccharide transporter
VSTERQTSHRQILKSTGIIGGEQIVVIISGIFRSKVIALWLGPAGVGVMSIYQSTVDLVRNLTGLGLGFSSVRNIAEAQASGDMTAVSKTTAVLRRWVWATGLLGTMLVLAFSKQLSRYSFHDEKHTWAFVFLSITILFSALSAGQLALLQGLRKILYMAKANVFGTLTGLVVSIFLLWWLRSEGIVLSLLVVSASALAFSWFYARKVSRISLRLGLKETWKEGLDMAKLGFFMVLTGLLSSASMYLTRIWVSRRMGTDAVGQFQAAWSISSLYLVMILNAMASDYYPRLSAVNKDNRQINVLVNEQTEVTLMIACPVVASLLVFSKFSIYALYSRKFDQSVSILQWQILGTFLRVVAWPVGFVFLAKLKTGLFVLSEVVWNVVYVGCMMAGWKYWGVEGTGIAFAVAYLMSTIVNLIGARRVTGFRWTGKAGMLLSLYAAIIFSVFLFLRNATPAMALGSGILLIGAAGFLSYYHLRNIFSLKELILKFIPGK